MADTYTNSSIIIYKEGDESLQRSKVLHTEDIDDRAYTIKEGDKLTTLAFKFYNDPLLWFLIADINEIENPFILIVGSDIIIPNQNVYGL